MQKTSPERPDQHDVDPMLEYGAMVKEFLEGVKASLEDQEMDENRTVAENCVKAVELLEAIRFAPSIKGTLARSFLKDPRIIDEADKPLRHPEMSDDSIFQLTVAWELMRNWENGAFDMSVPEDSQSEAWRHLKFSHEYVVPSESTLVAWSDEG